MHNVTTCCVRDVDMGQAITMWRGGKQWVRDPGGRDAHDEDGKVSVYNNELGIIRHRVTTRFYPEAGKYVKHPT